MRGFGILLMIFGIGSFILKENNMYFKVLRWVDNWGESTGNIIRGGMIGLGVVLILFSLRKKA